MKDPKFRTVVYASMISLLAANFSVAQTTASEPTGDGQKLLSALLVLSENSKPPMASPSVPSVPGTRVLSHGTAFTSLTYSTPRTGVKGAGGDGSAALGFALGDATETIGFQLTAKMLINISMKSLANSFTAKTSELGSPLDWLLKNTQRLLKKKNSIPEKR